MHRLLHDDNAALHNRGTSGATRALYHLPNGLSERAVPNALSDCLLSNGLCDLSHDQRLPGWSLCNWNR